MDAARHEFARQGYERATIRAIAQRAGVDPATIYHFFEDKAALLRAAVEFPVAAGVLDEVLGSDPPPSGSEVLETVLSLWQDPAVAERLSALLRVAVTHPDGSAAVGDLLERSVLGPLRARIGGDHADLRAGLVASQIAGLALLRLVIPFGPITDASVPELVSAIAPTIERYLSGALDRV